MAVPPRANFNTTLIDVISTSATFGKPISDNITVTVYKAPPDAPVAQTTLATIYTAETGGVTLTNPFTLPLAGLGAGEIDFWAGPGSYDIKIVDSSSPKRFADKLLRFDALPYDEGVTTYNLDDATVASPLGLNDYSSVRRGKFVLASTHTTTSTSYVLMSSPDRVQGVKLETDGIIWVTYSAEWRALSTACQAAIFLNSSPVVVKQSTTGLASLSSAVRLPTVSTWGCLVTETGGSGTVNGLQSQYNFSATPGPGDDASSGQFLGMGSRGAQEVGIFASAGVYDVSVRFLAAAGGQSLVKNRRLYVRAEAF